MQPLTGVCIVSPYQNGNALQRYKLEGTSSTSNIKSKIGDNQVPGRERETMFKSYTIWTPLFVSASEFKISVGAEASEGSAAYAIFMQGTAESQIRVLLAVKGRYSLRDWSRQIKLLPFQKLPL